MELHNIIRLCETTPHLSMVLHKCHCKSELIWKLQTIIQPKYIGLMGESISLDILGPILKHDNEHNLATIANQTHQLHKWLENDRIDEPLSNDLWANSNVTDKQKKHA